MIDALNVTTPSILIRASHDTPVSDDINGAESQVLGVYGSKGWMHLTGDGYEVYHGPKNEPVKAVKKKDLEPNEWDKAEIEFHFVNFLDCMRSRKWQDLNQDILQGHMSTAMMHLGNVSYRTGRKLVFNGNAEKFIDDDDANTYLTRQYRQPHVLPKKI